MLHEPLPGLQSRWDSPRPEQALLRGPRPHTRVPRGRQVRPCPKPASCLTSSRPFPNNKVKINVPKGVSWGGKTLPPRHPPGPFRRPSRPLVALSKPGSRR